LNPIAIAAAFDSAKAVQNTLFTCLFNPIHT
jgi:hypothetical protein